jgi:hypothetical protein
MEEIRRAVGWAKEDGYGHEFVDVTIRQDTLSAEGVAVGAGPMAFRLDYRLETGASFVTAHLSMATRGEGWSRSLDLRQSDGAWTASTTSHGEVDLPPPGGDLEALSGALDCDIQMSPLTNSMPVLRHGLLAGGEPPDFLMAWVAVPALSVVPSRQRYVPLGPLAGGGRTIRYVSLDSDFVADVSFDADGLVIDYPRLGTRLVLP